MVRLVHAVCYKVEIAMPLECQAACLPAWQDAPCQGEAEKTADACTLFQAVHHVSAVSLRGVISTESAPVLIQTVPS